MTELTTTTADRLHIIVRLPDDHTNGCASRWRKACAAEARRQLAATPTPDPAYSVPRTAELLDLHPETLRDYMRLPEHHPRRLHYMHRRVQPRRPGATVPNPRLAAPQPHRCRAGHLPRHPAPSAAGRSPFQSVA